MPDYSEYSEEALKEEGRKRIDWAERHMPVLGQIRERFQKEQPFSGLSLALSVHLEAKSACLARALARGGARVVVTGANPESTQDAVCAALADDCIVLAEHGAPPEKHLQYWKEALAIKPDIVIDDGADLINLLLGDCRDDAVRLIGACEETTSGVQRLRIWERENRLRFPVIAVNDARCKSLFDNFYGTGQSVWDAVMRSTNSLIGGKVVVVAGYGRCGKGIAHYAAGMGARVVITEIDPIPALLAMMDGYAVMPMDEAASLGDIFVTVTASIDVVTKQHFERMKDGAVICNAGHFNREIDLDTLESMAVQKTEARRSVTRYVLPDGKSLHVLANAALVNIAAGDGHPIEIMDMSFSLQALGAEYLAKNRGLPARVYVVPDDLDQEVASLKLASFGAAIDRETEAQRRYRLEDVVI
ncbi:MAG TPA: adenosylhomocysteinase [Bacillota bacterium]|nr:adenosylhomocysteinase [Bacillota bacterium]